MFASRFRASVLLLRPPANHFFTRSFSGSTADAYQFETLSVTAPAPSVLQVEMNRPSKGNAMNKLMWREFVECFERIACDTSCRAVILTGAGKLFTSGIDLADHAALFAAPSSPDPSRTGLAMLNSIRAYQKSFNSIEACPQPVIAAIHSACVGAGIDVASACDIRFCSSDAFFSIKEVDVGLAADVGTLQRMPKAVGNDSLFRELAYTGRRFDAQEAKKLGFISRILVDRSALISAAVALAIEIASKSPVAVTGTKHNLLFSRDHSVQEGLDHVALWNASALQSPDIPLAVKSFFSKEATAFDDLSLKSPLSNDDVNKT